MKLKIVCRLEKQRELHYFGYGLMVTEGECSITCMFESGVGLRFSTDFNWSQRIYWNNLSILNMAYLICRANQPLRGSLWTSVLPFCYYKQWTIVVISRFPYFCVPTHTCGGASGFFFLLRLTCGIVQICQRLQETKRWSKIIWVMMGTWELGRTGPGASIASGQ